MFTVNVELYEENLYYARTNLRSINLLYEYTTYFIKTFRRIHVNSSSPGYYIDNEICKNFSNSPLS